MSERPILTIYKGTFEKAPLYIVLIDSTVICVTRDPDVPRHISNIFDKDEEK